MTTSARFPVRRLAAAALFLLAPLVPATAGAAVTAQVASGYDHTCALSTAGAVTCWGSNVTGQLGDTTLVDKHVPTAVSGLASGVLAIAAGGVHACALSTAGAVSCWGGNDSGQLGDGTTTDRTAPVAVPALTAGVVAIAAGEAHTCALTTAGGVKCWGLNTSGQLGTGNLTDQHAPVDVTGLTSGVIAIAAGGAHTCAVKAAGTLECWGFGLFGQLGTGARPATVTTPTAVTGITEAVAGVSLGRFHSCARTATGVAKCWGWNQRGEVGDNTTTLRSAPVDVTGVASSTAIAAGGSHSCAVFGGEARCWGFNLYGQLGDGTNADKLTATPVTGLTGAAATTAGYWHTCARTTAGDVYCWGANDFGQVGDNTVVDKAAPVKIDGPTLPSQSIAFAAPTGARALETATLSASTTSSLAATFDSWTPLTCTVSGSTVTYLATGLCGLRASQAGNASFAAAPPVLRIVSVAAFVGTSDADHDGVPNAVELAEGLNPLVKDNDIFAATVKGARLFAMQQYRDFLGREGDASGVTAWTDAVSTGAWSREQVIDAFLNSSEFGGTMAPVARLYFATFQRVPDYAGLTGNAALVRAGTSTLAQMADFFAASPEFQATYGALSNAQFVTLLYNNVLGRAPDQAGLDAWVALLDGGTARGSVLLGFSESPEHIASSFNKVYVTMMYVGLLRRSPETAGFNGWVSALAGGTPTTTMIGGFLGSPEYHARFLP